MALDHSDPIEAAEVVYEKPLAGETDEILFGSDRGNTLWVKFSDKDGAAEWIGKFGCGGSSAMRVTKVSPPDKFLVLAGGFAYVVDATKRSLLHHLIDEQVQEVLYDPGQNRFITADYVRIRVVEFDGSGWSSPRIALDGIRNLTLEGNIVRGLAMTDYVGSDHEKEEDFSLDLDSRKITCATDCSRWDHS